MQNPKIAYLTHYAHVPSPSADGICVMKTCAELDRLGAEVELVIPDLHADIESEDIWDSYGISSPFKITVLPARALYKLGFPGRAIYKAYSVLHCIKQKAEIIFTRHIGLAILSTLLGKKTIYCQHVSLSDRGTPLLKIWQALMNTFPTRTGLAVITQAAKDRYLSSGVKDQSRIFIAPMGVELQDYQATAPIDLAGEYNLPSGKKIAGFSGNLYSGRGIEHLLEAATEFPELSFLIIGGYPEDIERLTEFTEKLKIENAHFTGFVPHKKVASLIASCDLLVMPYTTATPTHKDMSPMKMFEYMASGVPFIATDFPVLREVLTDRHNVLLVQPDSSGTLAEGIRTLINDPQLAASIAKNALQDAASYTWEERAKMILAWIEANF